MWKHGPCTQIHYESDYRHIGGERYDLKYAISLGESERISHLISDTRLDHLPLTSPLSAILILTGYVYFVYRIGPAYMSERKPFALKELIIVYDLLQIILNLALFAHVNIHIFFCDRQSSIELISNTGNALLDLH